MILLSSYFSAAEVLAAEYHRKSICEKMRDWLQSNKYEPWSFRRMWPLLLLLLRHVDGNHIKGPRLFSMRYGGCFLHAYESTAKESELGNSQKNPDRL